MTIKRPRSGTVIKITDSDPALAGDDDPKFELDTDFGDGRAMHVRTMEADDDGNVVEEVVIVATDIDQQIRWRSRSSKVPIATLKVCQRRLKC